MPMLKRTTFPVYPTATFPQRLRKMMLTKGVSQSELARMVDYTPTAIWNWLQGNTLPRAETLTALAQGLGVTEDWLRDGDQPADEQIAPTEASTRHSVAERVETLRMEIADLMGFDPTQVRLTLEFKAG